MISLQNRFLKHVDTVSSNKGCWLWIGAKDKGGYGRFNVNSKTELAHRFSYSYFIEVIPENLDVLHKCDTSSCVNPEHLFLGSQLDNMKDMISKGRKNSAIGNKHGSVTHPEKVPRGDSSGSRKHPESRPKGEKVQTAKLTELQVIEVRERYAVGNLSHRDLAKEYAVSHVTIGKLLNNKNWKHVK